jgi:AcrR family transcriptional regulator
MPRPKDEQKIERIADATVRTVLQTGFQGLKMADVAREAGMATGTLYIYYPDKTALVTDVFLRCKQQFASALFHSTSANSDFASVFRNWWMNFYQYAMQHPGRMLFTDQFLHSGIIPETVIAETDAWFYPLDAFLVTARSEGKLKQVDTELIKAQLMGPVLEWLKQRQKPHVIRGEMDAEQLFQMAWQSIQP